MTRVDLSVIGFPLRPPFPISSRRSFVAFNPSLETDVLLAITPSNLVS